MKINDETLPVLTKEIVKTRTILLNYTQKLDKDATSSEKFALCFLKKWYFGIFYKCKLNENCC